MSSASNLSIPARFPKAFQFLFENAPDDYYRYRAAWGGRGSGKSHSFAGALVIRARKDPLRILCAREIQDSIRNSSKRLLDDKIAQYGFGNFFESTDTQIRGQNGSLIVFSGLRSNPDAIKSMEGLDIAWIDEASRVSQRSLDILTPTVRKPNSEIWFTWNPDSPKDPVDVMFRNPNGPPPRTALHNANYDSNPWFPDVLREEMEWHKRTDPGKYSHIWLGQYRKNSEAQVFHNWRVAEFETPSDINRFYFGADWGFSIDPTVLVRCYIVGRTLYVDYEAWQIKCDIDKAPALFDTIPQSRKWPITADSSNPQSISYMRRHGFDRITHSVKGPGSVEEGVEFLKGYDIVVHPRCTHVIDELSSYSYEVDDHTGEVLPKLADKKNHTIDSLRYAIESFRRSTIGAFAPPIVVTRPRAFPT